MTRESSPRYRRHTLAVRVMHWINVLALAVLLASGLQIFNAYPSLHWGQASYNGKPPLLVIESQQDASGRLVGVTRVFGHAFETTGWLGVSAAPDGSPTGRAFPSWITLPGPQWLAMARQWHFFFAWLLVLNGLAYVAYAIASRHLARDLAPTRRDWRSIGSSIREHLRFAHPTGEAARHYNVLQKLTYLLVIFGLLPLMILMGWAMSPWLDTVATGWVDLAGGRQSARTIHFVVAWLLVAFVLVHVFEVVVSGLVNNLRSMITGVYEVPPPREKKNAQH